MTPYYEDDLVTLYHGDCREWMPPADVLVTDPPYGIESRVGIGGWRGHQRAERGADFAPVVGDDEPFDPALWLALGLPTVLFGANHYADRLPPSPSWLVWDKRVTMNSTDQADCEMAWTNLGGPARMFRLMWNVLSRAKDQRTYGGSNRPMHRRRVQIEHPTEKPVALMRWVLQRCPEGTVFDPYMGTGATLIAAKSLGRPSIGIEIEERYCEVAATRCSQEVLGLVS